MKWLETTLDDSSRLKSLTNLEGIQDKNLSLFGKIEEGMFFIAILLILNGLLLPTKRSQLTLLVTVAGRSKLFRTKL